jgi:transcriptional regulator with XRE-family HTH domain
LGPRREKLAAAAGTSQPTIAAYEAGRKSPTLETLGKLARSFGVEVAISFVPPMTREDLRSLAYHRAIVEKLGIDSASILVKARKNLAVMSKKHPGASKLFRLWEQWLDLSTSDLISCCLDSSLLARDMRQVTPFAGILSAGERSRIIKEFRKEKDR